MLRAWLLFGAVGAALSFSADVPRNSSRPTHSGHRSSVTNRSAGVTPLTFFLNTGGRRTRRLSSLSWGWKLDGNLHTLGYFAAEVCVGPPGNQKSFQLIVDTGSSLTAFPCQDCAHCGQVTLRLEPSIVGIPWHGM